MFLKRNIYDERMSNLIDTICKKKQIEQTHTQTHAHMTEIANAECVHLTWIDKSGANLVSIDYFLFGGCVYMCCRCVFIQFYLASLAATVAVAVVGLLVCSFDLLPCE